MQVSARVLTHPTACRTCRRRGRKCDRTLPTCQSCKDKGILCEGYVTRWPGVAARGRLAGRAIPVLDSDIQEESDHEPASAPKHDFRVHRHDHGPTGYTVALDPPDGLEELINYCFARELTTVFYIGPNPSDSPYVHYILPLTHKVLPLRYAVAASASCHLATRLDDDALEKQSLRLRLKATESLRQRLKDKEVSTTFGTLATILMMAQLDICSSESTEFETHLRAARTLISLHGFDGTDRAFFEQRLAWLDIMGSTTASRMPTFTSTEVKTTLGRCQSPLGRCWGFEVFPCPIDLFEYIADITMLYKLLAQPDVATAPYIEVVDKAILLGSQVQEWKNPTPTSEPKFHVEEAYRSAIILYLVLLFQLHDNDLFDIKFWTESIFDHARAVPTATPWSFSMLWPLFQAGLSLGREQQDERGWLIDRLTTISRAVGCGQFANTIEALEFVWQGDDSQQHRWNSITAGARKGRLMLA